MNTLQEKYSYQDPVTIIILLHALEEKGGEFDQLLASLEWDKKIPKVKKENCVRNHLKILNESYEHKDECKCTWNWLKECNILNENSTYDNMTPPDDSGENVIL